MTAAIFGLASAETGSVCKRGAGPPQRFPQQAAHAHARDLRARDLLPPESHAQD